MFSIIRRSFQFLSPQNFIPLSKTLVRSHLDYASSVWSPYKQKRIDTLENVQRRATRQLPTLAKLSYEWLIQLKLPTLAYRRIIGDMIEVYKIMNEIYDKNVTTFLKTRLESADRTRPRGHKYQLHIERVNKNIQKLNFSTRIINIWNNMWYLYMAPYSARSCSKALYNIVIPDSDLLPPSTYINSRESIQHMLPL